MSGVCREMEAAGRVIQVSLREYVRLVFCSCVSQETRVSIAISLRGTESRIFLRVGGQQLVLSTEADA